MLACTGGHVPLVVLCQYHRADNRSWLSDVVTTHDWGNIVATRGWSWANAVGAGDAYWIGGLAPHPRVPPDILSSSGSPGAWSRDVFIGIRDPGKVGLGRRTFGSGVLVQSIRLVSSGAAHRGDPKSCANSIRLGRNRGTCGRCRTSRDRNFGTSDQV